jgi:hypothetical protein
MAVGRSPLSGCRPISMAAGVARAKPPPALDRLAKLVRLAEGLGLGLGLPRFVGGLFQPERAPADLLEASAVEVNGAVLAGGFVMDRPLTQPATPVLSTTEWQAFLKQATMNDLFYEFTVAD